MNGVLQYLLDAIILSEDDVIRVDGPINLIPINVLT